MATTGSFFCIFSRRSWTCCAVLVLLLLSSRPFIADWFVLPMGPCSCSSERSPYLIELLTSLLPPCSPYCSEGNATNCHDSHVGANESSDMCVVQECGIAPLTNWYGSETGAVSSVSIKARRKELRHYSRDFPCHYIN